MYDCSPGESCVSVMAVLCHWKTNVLVVNKWSTNGCPVWDLTIMFVEVLQTHSWMESVTVSGSCPLKCHIMLSTLRRQIQFQLPQITMKNYPETYSFAFKAMLNSLQWIMHESEHRVKKTLNSWSLAHWWSVCGVSDKGFDRKWLVTWSGNQKLCCSWGHLHCHIDCGFLSRCQQTSITQAPAFSCVTNALFCTDVFHRSFLKSVTHCIVLWILHVLFPDFLTLSLIWYSINFISINYYSQEKLPLWLYEKKLFS